MARGPSNNPAIWGGGYTFMNRVPGQPLFLVDPNSHFDPTTQLVLNPKAWVEPPYGTFGSSAAYFNDFRWQRQPAESLAFGRIFAVGKEGKIPPAGPGGIPEHLQPHVLCRAQQQRRYDDNFGYRESEQPERHGGPVVLWLGVCQLAERRIGSTTKRPDRGAVYVLIDSNCQESESSRSPDNPSALLLISCPAMDSRSAGHE